MENLTIEQILTFVKNNLKNEKGLRYAKNVNINLNLQTGEIELKAINSLGSEEFFDYDVIEI